MRSPWADNRIAVTSPARPFTAIHGTVYVDGIPRSRSISRTSVSTVTDAISARLIRSTARSVDLCHRSMTSARSSSSMIATAECPQPT